MVTVQFTKLDPRAVTPTQAYPGDAGWDLFALEEVTVGVHSPTWIKTGLAVAIPEEHYGRICGRSSAASRGFHVIEGVIDCGYRGELLLRVVSDLWAEEPVYATERGHGVIWAGMGLGQLIVQPIPRVELVEVEALPLSARGTSGFGSSGS